MHVRSFILQNNTKHCRARAKKRERSVRGYIAVVFRLDLQFQLITNFLAVSARADNCFALVRANVIFKRGKFILLLFPFTSLFFPLITRLTTRQEHVEVPFFRPSPLLPLSNRFLRKFRDGSREFKSSSALQ